MEVEFTVSEVVDKQEKPIKQSFYYKSFICKVNLGQCQICCQGRILGQGRILDQGKILGQGQILGQGHVQGCGQGQCVCGCIWLRQMGCVCGCIWLRQMVCVCGCIWLRQMSLLTAPPTGLIR